MKSSPVSFGSLMCFSISQRPSVGIPDMLKLSFNRNPNLNMYNLQDTFTYTADKPDGTVHNAYDKFTAFLDRLHAPKLPKGSKNVIVTEADFFVNPYKTEKKYFVTAATAEDEKKIFEELTNTREFYTVQFRTKDKKIYS